MSESFTPGPWKSNTFTDYPSKRGGYFIYSRHSRGNRIATLETNGEYAVEGALDGTVMANARLIASAPALLASLKNVLPVFDNEEMRALARVYHQEILEAEKAIVQATLDNRL